MKHITLFYLVYLGLSVSCVFAQNEVISDISSNEDYLTLSLEDILNIEVTTSSKKAENILHTPAYVNILTDEEIRLLNFNTLAELLEYVTGTSSSNTEGNRFLNTAIRGNAIAHYNVNTLLMFDGVPIYNAYNGSFDHGTIPLSAIKQIEIVKGSNSVLYGTNAINAVINIIPKDIDSDGTCVMGRVRGGSLRTGVVNNALLYRDHNFKLRVFTDFYTTEGEERTYQKQANGEEYTLRKNLNNTNLATIMEYKGWKANFQYTNRRIPVTDNTNLFDLISVIGTDTITIPTPENVDEYHIMGGLRYLNQVSENFSYSAGISYQDWSSFSNAHDLNKLHTSQAFRAIAEANFSPTESTTGIVGLEFNNYLGQRSRSGILNGQPVSRTDINPTGGYTNDIAVYANGSTGLNNKLTVFYGLRFYASDFEKYNFEHLSPRLSLVYNIKKNLTVKAIYAESFRIPMYIEKSSTVNTFHGDPNLDPEVSESYDLVLAGALKKLSWDIDLYYMTISNKILRIEATDEDREALGNPGIVLLYKNVTQYRHLGAEANLKFNFNNKLNGTFGYAFANVENPNDKMEEIGDDPWFFTHMFNTGINYNISKKVGVTLSGKYISPWGEGTVQNEGYTVAEDYILLNGGLNFNPIPDKDIALEFKVDNLLATEVIAPELGNRRLNTSATVPMNVTRRFFVGIRFGL